VVFEESGELRGKCTPEKNLKVKVTIKGTFPAPESVGKIVNPEEN